MPPRPKKTEEATPSPAETPPPSVIETKPRSTEMGAWGRPVPVRVPSSASASSAAAKAKAAAAAAAAAKSSTPMSIAAQAARNLGGFVPNKIFVGGVPITVSEEQFRTCFEVYGNISKVELHALRGFGYITYETVEAVDTCLEKYEEHYLSKKWVEVKRSIPRELIDAYEREQRRLHALHNEANAAVGSGTAAPTAPTAPTVSSNPVPAAPPNRGWGQPPGSIRTPAAPPGATPGGATALPGRPLLPPPGGVARSRTASGPTAGTPSGGWGNSGGSTPAGSLGRISQLKEMGFSDEVSRRVLAECAWDVNKAIDHLLLHGGDLAEPEGGPSEEVEAEAEAPDAPEMQSTAGLPSAEKGSGKGGSNGVGHRGPAAHEQEEAKEQVGRRTWAGAVAGSSRSSEPAASPQPERASPSPAEVEVEPEEAEAVEPPAPKRLERVMQTWTADDPSQLSIVEDQFVNVWTETGTDNGWIHAEIVGNEERVGWVPTIVLQKLPEGQRWMAASQNWEALDASQCSATEGDMVVVWISSLTKEGWTYSESQKDFKGWLPVFCLDWNEN
ncbi:unnamed protein product [Polarella glacialis]|uniref:Uncharacterized protein n=2 Tax=Polarella glacialis TaxID=89957 RepID=A0A813KKC3_POLGL|nr:unnamed protein product [Polarella glacialis]